MMLDGYEATRSMVIYFKSYSMLLTPQETQLDLMRLKEMDTRVDALIIKNDLKQQGMTQAREGDAKSNIIRIV